MDRCAGMSRPCGGTIKGLLSRRSRSSQILKGRKVPMALTKIERPVTGCFSENLISQASVEYKWHRPHTTTPAESAILCLKEDPLSQVSTTDLPAMPTNLTLKAGLIHRVKSALSAQVVYPKLTRSSRTSHRAKKQLQI